MRIWIDYKFPSLNEYINAERRNRFAAAKIKKEWTERVMDIVLAQTLGDKKPNLKFPTAVRFIVHEQNQRRDIDNVSAMVSKFCLDGMVKAGLLPDDSQKYVNKIECDLVVDGMVGVEILIDE